MQAAGWASTYRFKANESNIDQYCVRICILYSYCQFHHAEKDNDHDNEDVSGTGHNPTFLGGEKSSMLFLLISGD